MLDAAARLVAERGVQELTMDAAAAAAGVTKGGLIYHFKTRDELLAALVERLVSELDPGLHEDAGSAPPSVAATLIAMADATFDMPDDQKRLLSNMLAAASSHPHLMAPAQQMFDRTYAALAQGSGDAGNVLLLAAALDGISLLELLNLHHFTPAQRQAMRDALAALVRDLP